MKNKKFSLIACGAGFVLCSAALVGTTLAWYTDTAENTGNVIASGKLDVDFLKWNGNSYESVDKGNPIFKNDVLWEPGMTQVAYLKVENKGTLSFDYNIIVDVTGDEELADTLTYSLIDSFDASKTTLPTSWSDFESKQTESGALPYGETVAAPNGNLKASESDCFAVAIHMNEDAGNEAMGKKINIDFTVRAKQTSDETDGFGNSDYDSDAVYAVTSEEEFAKALSEAKEGDVISLSSDMVLQGRYDSIPSGVTIEGNGATLVTGYVEGGSQYGLHLVNAHGVTIKDLNFQGSGAAASSAANRPMAIYLSSASSDITIENCDFTTESYGQMGHSVWADIGCSGITVRNCNIARPINLCGAQGTVSDVLIENNTFNTTGDTSAVTVGGSLENVRLLGNKYHTDASGAGLVKFDTDILSTASFKSVEFEGNTPIEDPAAGKMIFVENAASSFSGVSDGSSLWVKVRKAIEDGDIYGDVSLDDIYFSGAEAATVTVSDSSDLSSKLNSLGENSGIVLAAGTNITRSSSDEAITLKNGVSIDGNGATITMDEKSVFSLTTGNSLSGFTFHSTDNTAKPIAINATNAQDIAISNCVFDGTTKGMGHGIWLSNAEDVTVTDCTFTRPMQLTNDCQNIEIRDNVFENGSGINGITISGALTNVTISGNTYNSWFYPTYKATVEESSGLIRWTSSSQPKGVVLKDNHRNFDSEAYYPYSETEKVMNSDSSTVLVLVADNLKTAFQGFIDNGISGLTYNDVVYTDDYSA